VSLGGEEFARGEVMRRMERVMTTGKMMVVGNGDCGWWLMRMEDGGWWMVDGGWIGWMCERRLVGQWVVMVDRPTP
jgi:hypothetical protein